MEKFMYRHTGRTVVSIVSAVLVYLTLFPIFFLFCSSIMQGFIEAGGDGEGYGLLIMYTAILFLPIILFLWVVGALLLIRDIKLVRASVGIIPPQKWLKFLPVIILLGITSIFCSLFFIIA